MVKNLLFVLLVLLTSMDCLAQEYVTISGTIKDGEDGETLPAATVSMRGKHTFSTYADNSGRYSIKVIKGDTYLMTVSYVGYDQYKRNVKATQNQRINPSLKSNLRLSEVVITAKEGQGPVTTSVIGRDAMNQLQPNSFADLLELLPGGYAKDPDMGSANTIQLRETGTMGSYGQSSRTNNFAISSLGTQFIVDGAPISTDANLQFSPLSDTQSTTVGSTAEDQRNITNKGVDMRTISTDDIEKVEIMRGIPSAEYGNLTSGVVNIHKIRKAIPWTARFKADGYSKLFSLGKGLSLNKGNTSILNFDLGYLDSKVDPTDNLQSYKRVTGSVRYTLKQKKETYNWNFNSSFDYSGSFDNSKEDPDLNYGKIDEYKSSYNRMVFTNSFKLNRPEKLFREFEVNTSASLQLDRLHQIRLVAPQRYTLVPTNTTEGESEVGAVYNEYMTDYLCDGKPFNVYVKGKGLMQFHVGKKTDNRLKYGINWDLTKNYGRGQVYDLNYPLSTSGWESRPRRYKDIPSLQNLSLFLEDTFLAKLGGSQLEGMFGVRFNTIPGLDSQFDMAGKIYADPRFNVNWRLPYVTMAGKPLKIAFNAGWGVTTKNPTLNYLYPNKYYSNFVELAYYDANNPETDSRFVVQSYIQDPTNYHITPARNHKWEIRLDLDWNDHSFSIDYFRENMTSGFRYSRIYGVYTYNRYDTSEMGAGVDWRTLSYDVKQVLDGYQQASNGSRLVKQGIELQYTSARIRPLRTRINVSGAWFHTSYTNSLPMFDAVSSVIDNQAVSEMYVGLYDWNDGRVNDRLNTNVTFDTQIPEWGFIFTTSFQFMWLIRTERQWLDGYPIGYISYEDGEVHAYTTESANNIYLQQLIQTYNDAAFEPFTVPMSMVVNLKATKKIGKFMKLSFFANKLLDYLPDYESNGNIIRRNASPYFGVEANITL